jgi:hypothetical protein
MYWSFPVLPPTLAPPTLDTARSHDGLATRADSDVLMDNLHRLLAAAPNLVEREHGILKGAHDASRGVGEPAGLDAVGLVTVHLVLAGQLCRLVSEPEGEPMAYRHLMRQHLFEAVGCLDALGRIDSHRYRVAGEFETVASC